MVVILLAGAGCGDDTSDTSSPSTEPASQFTEPPSTSTTAGDTGSELVLFDGDLGDDKNPVARPLTIPPSSAVVFHVGAADEDVTVHVTLVGPAEQINEQSSIERTDKRELASSGEAMEVLEALGNHDAQDFPPLTEWLARQHGKETVEGATGVPFFSQNTGGDEGYDLGDYLLITPSGLDDVYAIIGVGRNKATAVTVRVEVVALSVAAGADPLAFVAAAASNPDVARALRS